jgi:hypothetical protein
MISLACAPRRKKFPRQKRAPPLSFFEGLPLDFQQNKNSFGPRRSHLRLRRTLFVGFALMLRAPHR